eukprot:CAMPEP_0113297574 /NCGR_PEP_ID=MMETSP0010_2-20120614/375_1 /TAXON_ID=216773 ORGANISM="Corethron hystrix, Strain 308" /NCGR_SAMPLE_ID=MMETSP0010_2 /ASSEMBLY_ACC=CAM_ASM_000155 /LENGTH=78 /DNA_ID=CAMNT_0000150477 /DNA_START=1247 /DNA_END=1483 /DNA_ORIENTATION=- /assembly_acc=CAM_ASM_000155
MQGTPLKRDVPTVDVSHGSEEEKTGEDRHLAQGGVGAEGRFEGAAGDATGWGRGSGGILGVAGYGGRSGAVGGSLPLR